MPMPDLTRCAVLLFAMAVAACGDENPVEPQPQPEPDPEPAFISTVVNANPINSLSAVVFVRARLYDSAFVRYWKDAAGPARTPARVFGSDSTVRIPVLALSAARTYSVETNLWVGDSVQVVDTASFRTGALPDWIPAARAQGSDTTPGFLAISYPDGPVIIDNTGEVRWYLFAPDDFLLSFQAHDNGRYTLFRLTDSTAVFHVLDELGRETGTLGCVGRPTRFHDLLWQAGGDYWALCNDSTDMDLTAIGGRDSVNVVWTVIQHVSADGELLWEWHAADHFEVTDAETDIWQNRDRANLTHGNSIILDVDGNLLVTFRSLNEVTKINTTTGEVMWRFGGLRNEFTFVNDAKASFERPHGLRLAGPGQIQFLDNGLQAPSRLVRYVINPVTMTATLVWEFLDSPTTFTPVGGSTEYYPNGYGVVTFGRAGRVVEVDPVGNRSWELVGIDNVYVFRVQRLSSLYELGRSLTF